MIQSFSCQRHTLYATINYQEKNHIQNFLQSLCAKVVDRAREIYEFYNVHVFIIC